jgi:hypothetical protein
MTSSGVVLLRSLWIGLAARRPPVPTLLILTGSYLHALSSFQRTDRIPPLIGRRSVRFRGTFQYYQPPEPLSSPFAIFFAARAEPISEPGSGRCRLGWAAPVFPGATVRLSGRRAVRSAAEPTGGLTILARATRNVKRPYGQGLGARRLALVALDARSGGRVRLSGN